MTDHNDGRDIAANIFDKTAGAAASIGAGLPDPAGLALKIAAGIAKAIAVLIRAVGIDDTAKAIEELVARKREGVITDDDLADDDDAIAGAVSDLYVGDSAAVLSDPTHDLEK